MADAVDDRFELERQVGAGGMGIVWRARDRRTGTRVALKLIPTGDAADQARFAREARLLATLDHPAIVRHVADGEHTRTAGERFLAMEWVEGTELRARLRSDALTTADALAVAARIADALAHAHARGVVHRDVKPSNVILRDGAPAAAVLVDFGIARLADDDTRLTRSGTTIGTPAYMAPEQIRGDREVDSRTDLYGLGATLFECLTGRPPHHGAQSMAVMAKVLLEDAPRLRTLRPELPPALDDLVAALLTRDRDARPRDAAIVAAALRGLADPSLPPGPAIAPPTDAITGTEARLICVVLAKLGDTGAPAIDVTAPTRLADVTDDLPIADRMLALAHAHDVVLERLRGGWAAVLSSAGVATDLVGRGARYALALREAAPGARIALAMRHTVVGPGVLDEMLEAIGDRIGTAGVDLIAIDDVAAGLLDARFDLDDTADGPVLRGARTLAADTGRRVLGRVTPLVGRDRELRVLEAVVAGWDDDPGPRVALVTGPPGIGKSRLAAELIARLRAAGPVDVWVGRGDPLRRGAPFALLAPALRDAIDALPGATPPEIRARLIARVDAKVTAADRGRVADFLGALLGLPPHDDDGEALRVARDNPALLADQIRRAWEDLVLAECAVQPIVLVLEDLHWGDAATVKLADGALRAARGRPLLVLALARPEAMTQFPGLFAERDLVHVTLGELGERSIERLITAVLGKRADAGARARIIEYAAGNPLYVEELMRAVALGCADDASVPRTVLAMAVARLDALAADDRRVLRAGSVFGDAFPAAGAAHLLGGGAPLDVDARLRDLADEEWLTADRPGTLRFRHNLLREAAYATIPDDDRRVAHRLAAAWLEVSGEHDAAVLAAHLERGGDDAGAGRHHQRAAEQALDASDLDDAIAHAAAATRLGATGEALGRMQLVEAIARYWLGEHAGAQRAAGTALDLLPPGSDAWWRAIDQSAEASPHSGEIAVLAGHEALIRAALDADAALPAAALTAAATVIMQTALTGALPRATALLARVDAAVEGVALPAIVAARLAFARATLAILRGDLGAVIADVRETIARYDELGDVRTSNLMRGNLGWVYTELGAGEAAWEAARDGAERATAEGIARVVANARGNQAIAAWQLGRLDEALALADEAAFADAGEPSAKAQLYRARVLRELGRLDDAESAACHGLRELSEMPPGRAFAQAVLADVMLSAGRAEDALAITRVAVATIATLDSVDEGEALIRCVHAEALLATGRADDARAVARVARDRLRDRATRIADPAWRASFLERVPDHARLLALAARWDTPPG